jgi:hypothetical protein
MVVLNCTELYHGCTELHEVKSWLYQIARSYIMVVLNFAELCRGCNKLQEVKSWLYKTAWR